MVPDSELFAEPCLSSATELYSYNMASFVLKCPQGRDEEDGILSDSDSIVKQHGALMHETVHWMQQQSTSIGCLFSLLSYSQQRTTIDAISGLDEEIRRKLTQRRTLNQCILPLKGNDLDEDESSGWVNQRSGRWENKRIGLYYQIWYEHQFVYKWLYDSSAIEHISWRDPEITFGEILGDCILQACTVCGFGQYPGHEEARSIYHFTKASIVKVYDLHLTTKSLFEASATANELSFYWSMRKGIHANEFNMLC